MTEEKAFAERLLARGVELYVAGNRVKTWPKDSWTTTLTDEDRLFIRERRLALKEMIRAGLQPRLLDDAEPTNEPSKPGITLPNCPRCGERPCVGRDSHFFHIFHWDDPEVIAKKNAEATKVMMKQIGRTGY